MRLKLRYLKACLKIPIFEKYARFACFLSIVCKFSLQCKVCKAIFQDKSEGADI